MRSTRRVPARHGRPLAVGPAATALAVTVAALGALTACTADGTSADSVTDQKAAQLAGGDSSSTVSPAPPGKYRTLPSPCTAVDADLLKQLVPAVPDIAGSEALTYDTNRRVGCSWRGTTTAGASDTLRIDLERVVSYDPAISDEAQAQQDFTQKAADASIPALPTSSDTPTTPTPPTTTPPTGGTGSGGSTTRGTNGASTDSGTGDPNGTGTGTGTDAGSGNGGSSPDLLPRRLTDVGNAAFINDVVAPHSKQPRRDVTLVFRTANVLVTVTYAESAPSGSLPPSSADLQKGAQEVADQIERKVKG
ncbi:hypothetical protein SAMN05216251_10542 [Actinacidiphila alni]|uniref:DUF3558 domain-containing protein n=1 Tax=Actinacidiphila alni TaxID=380248 RepID=A0A1I2D254_9ACTN|nr:hypothetical protein [Actinacidiphila alni]SFE74584.1 hypothetical protein SAMN05216251_10542 [Actinacidiphila alni]